MALVRGVSLRVALLAVAAVFVCTNAAAITGNDAIRHMLERNGEPDLTFITYAAGFLDAEVGTLINAKEAKKAGASRWVRPVCQPLGSSASQAAQVIVAELRANPADNHKELSLITRKALVNAWPCSEDQLRSPS